MIVAVSDIHLGTEHLDSVDPDRAEFKQFLRYLKADLQPTHFVLNGDIEDFWRRDMRTLTRENYDVFVLLNEMRDSGIEVHYVLGNHDWYARKDVGIRREQHGEMEKGWYYDNEYVKDLTITTDGTTYTFMHGHQFDPIQDPWYFDKLAVISTDSIGATFHEKWALFGEVDGITGVFQAILKLVSDRISHGAWDNRVGEMDRCAHDHDLDEHPRPARRYVEGHAGIDWLCIGHTHCAGIRDDTNVANSGAWLNKQDTYLVLEEKPRLMDWNDGDPNLVAEGADQDTIRRLFQRFVRSRD